LPAEMALQMCRSGALNGAHLVTFCARLRCAPPWADGKLGAAMVRRRRTVRPCDIDAESVVVARKRSGFPSVECQRRRHYTACATGAEKCIADEHVIDARRRLVERSVEIVGWVLGHAAAVVDHRPRIVEIRAPPVDHRVPGEVPNLIGRRFSVEFPT